MMDRKALIAERDYQVDKLTDISRQVKRLTDEADELKSVLDALPDGDPQRSSIRRRRRYLGRRKEELNAERDEAISRRDALVSQLRADAASPDQVAGLTAP